MNRNTFRVSSLFTVLALAIFAFSPEPSKLFIVVLPLAILFPVAVNKRRKTMRMSFKDAVMAFIPFVGVQQLKRLYLVKS